MGIKFKIGIFMILIAIISTGITGCVKNYSDYNCIWTSEDGCIQLDSETGIAILNIDGVDQTKRIEALSDSGQTYLHFTYVEGGSTESSSTVDIEEMTDSSNITGTEGRRYYTSTIWEANSYIRNGKLYLTVVKDYVSDWEGKMIVLEQKPRQE